jgi:hypothetical protein
MSPFNDPSTDTMLLRLKEIALNGSERGALYDQGVLSVISQIEKEGSFTANPALILRLVECGVRITDSENEDAERILRERGWSLAEGVEYANGIAQAQGLLSHYKRNKSS